VLLMAGHSQSFEWQFKRPNGSCFEADVHLSAVTLDDVSYLQSHIRDISERKSIERELDNYFEVELTLMRRSSWFPSLAR